jgi:hypothetical protein
MTTTARDDRRDEGARSCDSRYGRVAGVGQTDRRELS